MEHNMIQMNRWCNDLHDDEKIIFCKRDFIVEEFKRIERKKNDCLLIIANSDYTFSNDLLKFCPKNVKHIFCTNTICDSDLVTPIPIGVEMETKAKREGHGFINEGIFHKKKFLLNPSLFETEKSDKIYANFNVKTNPKFRAPLKTKCVELSHIHYDFEIPYESFVKNIKSHIGSLSPRGNGIECVRTYEILYLNEVPIVVGDINEYSVIKKKIYDFLPVVFIDKFEELENINFLKKEIERVRNKSLDLLKYDYWVDRILDKKNKLNK